MTLKFTENGWADYLSWENDKKIRRKINELIKATMRTPFEGIGKPEALKHNLTGCWSRRIEREHRLVYQVEENEIIILSCRYHYTK